MLRTNIHSLWLGAGEIAKFFNVAICMGNASIGLVPVLLLQKCGGGKNGSGLFLFLESSVPFSDDVRRYQTR